LVPDVLLSHFNADHLPLFESGLSVLLSESRIGRPAISLAVLALA
jgi:hypothetical protein